MRKRSIPTLWLSDIKDQKEKESMEFILRNNQILVRRLLEILEKYDQEEYRAETSISEYDSPSWSHKQADRNGARRAIKKVRELFLFD